jgi:predicted extracellular nuclease
MSKPFVRAARLATCVLVSSFALLGLHATRAEAASPTTMGPAALPSISIADVTLSEGNSSTRTAVFTVSLSSPATSDVTFYASTAEVSAVGNDDFQHYYSSQRTIPVGQSSITLSLVIFGDTVVEADETFEVLLEGVTNATVAKGVATGTIVNDDSGASPTLMVGDMLVSESDSGIRTATFTVQLSKAAASAVSFDIATVNGSALAGIDYASLSLANQTIAAGELYKQFSIAINGDTTTEPDETFTVNLSNASGAGIGRGQAVGTIANDDNVSAIKISVGDVYVDERDSGPQTATFTVYLSQAATSTVSFDIRTEDSSATAGSDYVARALVGQTIAAGQTTRTFTVTVNGDTEAESEERFVVTIGKIANAAVEYADYHGVATIPNDDAVLSIGNLSKYEGDSGDIVFSFPVTLSAPVSTPVQFHALTCDGTAKAIEGDYWSTGDAYFTYINPGYTTSSVLVRVRGDIEEEPNETFCVDLTDIGGAAPGTTHAIGTILNDDAGPPTVSVANGSVLEGTSGVQALVFPVTLSSAPKTTIVVSYHSESCGGTAEPDVNLPAYQMRDYIPADGMMYISNGVNHMITVGVRGDMTIEPDEQFCIKLDSASDGVIGNATATGTIINDDLPPTLSLSDASVSEGDFGLRSAVFTASLTGPLAAPVTFEVTTDTGTAIPDVDYVSRSGFTQTIPAGQTSVNVPININGDTDVEGNETFVVNLGNVTGVPLVDGQGIGTIVNDDKATLSVGNVSVTEGDSGVRTATFELNLSRAIPTQVTFDVATANGSATAGTDYVARSQLGRIIDGGRTRAVFEVQVSGDAVAEADETFNVTISNVQGATLGNGSAVGTIVNDDGATASIAAIQGRAAESPLSGEAVLTEGVVTALTDGGFFLQAPDARSDADETTSEGLFVASRDRSVVVGDLVRAQGRVQEIQLGTAPDQPTQTTLVASGVSVLDHGEALPRAIALDGRNAGAGQAMAGLERFEGMRVSVADVRVVAPSGGRIDETTGQVRGDGRFYGVARGVARPFREPGRNVLERVRGPVDAGAEVFDANPERLQVDSLGQRGAGLLSADAGDVVTGLVGVLADGGSVYRVLPDPSAALSVASGANPKPVSTATPSQATIGSFSLRRLLDGVRDGGEPVPESDAHAIRLAKSANAVCAYARSPAILAVTDIENRGALEELAAAVNSRAGNLLFPLSCSDDPGYESHVGASSPGANRLGVLVSTRPVRPGVPWVEVRAVDAQATNERFVHKDGSSEALFESSPLRLQARINGAEGGALEVTVIASRFSALDGDLSAPGTHGWATRGDYLRARRNGQAVALARLVQVQQRTRPGVKLVVLGDFEASEFDDGHADLVGMFTGSDPTVRARRPVGLVDPALANLTTRLPRGARYTVVRDGSAQAVDHVLVSKALMAAPFDAHVEVARINADFGEDNFADPSVPMRVSDHDPVVLFLEMP